MLFLKKSAQFYGKLKENLDSDKIFLIVNSITLIRQDKHPVRFRSHTVSYISGLVFLIRDHSCELQQVV